MLHATETGISSGLMSHLAHIQTVPYHIFIPLLLFDDYVHFVGFDIFVAIRQLERKSLVKGAFLQGLNIALALICPTLAAVGTFCVHVATGKDLTTSQVCHKSQFYAFCLALCSLPYLFSLWYSLCSLALPLFPSSIITVDTNSAVATLCNYGQKEDLVLYIWCMYVVKLVNQWVVPEKNSHYPD